jgi:copper homeostasis protein CutC
MLCMLPVLCSEALEVLVSLGIPRVLTSGGQPTAMKVGHAC